jgi:hypothetical protein
VPGERSSPSLLFLSQRLSVVREMEKVSTTSFLAIPRSTASTALLEGKSIRTSEATPVKSGDRQPVQQTLVVP